MQKHPFVLREDVSPEDAARQMDTRRVTSVPVVDAQGMLVGLLDQADLLRYYTDVPASVDTTDLLPETARTGRAQMIGETSVQAVPLVTGEMLLTELLPLVQQVPQRRVIVVDETGKAIGIIEDSDLLVACGFASHRSSLRALASRVVGKLPETWERHRSSSGLLTAREVMRPLVLTHFVHPPTASQRAALFTIAEAIRAEVARLASDCGIIPHVENQTNTLQALFSLQWADLEDAQPQKLRRYGPLHPHLQEALGPGIRQLASYSLAIADMLSEARAPDDILRLLNLFDHEEEKRDE